MSRYGRQSATAIEWIRGWVTSDGTRHPGILERLEVIEKKISGQSRLLWIVLASVLLDVATNTSGHLIPLLRDAAQTAGTLLSYIQ